LWETYNFDLQSYQRHRQTNPHCTLISSSLTGGFAAQNHKDTHWETGLKSKDHSII
jgi:hypothetical protein